MRLLLIIIASALLFSCKSKSSETSDAKSKDRIDSTHFFQVAEFIQGEINEVNKTPYFIYKLDVTNNKKDSSTINNAVFNKVAKQFLQPNINDPSLKKYYTESVFFDQTTKSYTFSYATTNKELVIQNVDVLLDEDAKTVKRIFIRKFYNYTDSSAIEQLSWKPNESFRVMRLVQTSPDKSETSKETMIVWNDKG